jgi:hypothetical protein
MYELLTIAVINTGIEHATHLRLDVPIKFLSRRAVSVTEHELFL